MSVQVEEFVQMLMFGEVVQAVPAHTQEVEPVAQVQQLCQSLHRVNSDAQKFGHVLEQELLNTVELHFPTVPVVSVSIG